MELHCKYADASVSGCEVFYQAVRNVNVANQCCKIYIFLICYFPACLFVAGKSKLQRLVSAEEISPRRAEPVPRMELLQEGP